MQSSNGAIVSHKRTMKERAQTTAMVGFSFLLALFITATCTVQLPVEREREVSCIRPMVQNGHDLTSARYLCQDWRPGDDLP